MALAEASGRARSRPRFAAFSVSFLVLLVSAAFGTGSALATEVHVYSHSFGSGELALSGVSGLAIDQESGEVYVADTGNSRIAKFTAGGVPDGTLATITAPSFIAVDNSGGSSKGDVYVVDSSTDTITKLTPLGLPVAGWGTAGKLSGLGEIVGIAVDPDGNLWVYNSEIVMREFDPAGTKLSEFTSPFFKAGKRGIAVDAAHDLYVVRGEATPAKMTSTGNELFFNFGTFPAGGIAVDSSDDEVYISHDGTMEGGGAFIQRLTPAGKEVERFALTGEPGELPRPAAGLAISSTTGDVYAATLEGGEIKVYSVKDIPPPISVVTSASGITASSVQVSGTVNPNGAMTTCKFEYTTKAAYEGSIVEGKNGFAGAQSTPCDADPGAGEGAVAVAAELEGLVAGQTYEVRLAATNVGGTGLSAPLVPSVTTLPSIPSVSDQLANEITTSEATIHSTIVSHGSATTYEAEYLTESAYQAEGFGSSQTVATSIAGPLPPDAEPHEVLLRVIGLTPGTKYVFRVAASNSIGTASGGPTEFSTRVAPGPLDTACPNQLFRTGFASLLPDCRAYELTSPTMKNGLNMQGLADYLVADPSGSKVGSLSTAGSGFPASGGARQEPSAMLSVRAGDSWSTQRVLPPEEFGAKAGFLGSSEDLRYALVEAADAANGPARLLLLDTALGTVTRLSPPQTEATYPGAFAYDSINSDGSRVIFESRASLAQGASPGKVNLYIWDRETGSISVLGLLPAAETGKAPPGGAFGGAYAWPANETSRGGASNGQYVEALHAASPEGDQIYFTAGGTGQLYLRRRLTGPNPTSVRVSRAATGVKDANGSQPAAFQEATPDGSRAFFVSSQKLTPDASTGPADEGADLYRYEVSGNKLVDIVGNQTSQSNPAGAEVIALLGASSDGATGYFVAHGVLAQGGEAGGRNIYRFAETPGGGFTLSFIASLTQGLDDGYNWSVASYSGAPVSTEYFGRSSRVTANGQRLIFTSEKSLTGYNNGGCGPVAKPTAPCREIFIYSAPEDKLECVSCNPTGERPSGDAELTASYLNAGSLISPLTRPEPRLTRNVSADGSRIVFQTPDPLVAADTNGGANCRYLRHQSTLALPTCMDVYEWEAPGAPGGSCTKPEVNGGCIYLLSSGIGTQPSYFVDASSDGSDVFIATASQSVPIDHDELFDIYDVGTDRGLASQFVTPEAPCGEGSCNTNVLGAGAALVPGTSVLQGPGNPKKVKTKKCHRAAKRCRHRGKHKRNEPTGHPKVKQHHGSGHKRSDKGGSK